jgi:hypothetical protein
LDFTFGGGGGGGAGCRITFTAGLRPFFRTVLFFPSLSIIGAGWGSLAFMLFSF